MAENASATDIFPPDSADKSPFHGGDLSAARRLFPGAPEPFLDLSTGINPNPYPLPRLPADIFARLPDGAAMGELVAVAATRYGAASPAHVVAGPGTQILLPLTARLVRPGCAVIVSPTYGEHARAAALAGHRVTEVPGLAEVRAMNTRNAADLVIVTNPNNPDGRLTKRAELSALAADLRARGGVLVVDEAFMDVGPLGESLAVETWRDNLVVLRSFGKFFGLAGLRLGFALASPQRVERLSADLGPWAVCGPALAVGTAALADIAWIERTRSRLAKASRRLDAILVGAGLEIVGGTTLFRLVRTSASGDLFAHLGRAGILVRIFPDHTHWLRFGLPANERAWRRLQIAMAAFSDTR